MRLPRGDLHLTRRDEIDAVPFCSAVSRVDNHTTLPAVDVS